MLERQAPRRGDPKRGRPDRDLGRPRAASAAGGSSTSPPPPSGSCCARSAGQGGRRGRAALPLPALRATTSTATSARSCATSTRPRTSPSRSSPSCSASLPRYEPRSVPFSAWILRVAHNAAIDHMRARRAVPVEEVRGARGGGRRQLARVASATCAPRSTRCRASSARSSSCASSSACRRARSPSAWAAPRTPSTASSIAAAARLRRELGRAAA